MQARGHRSLKPIEPHHLQRGEIIKLHTLHPLAAPVNTVDKFYGYNQCQRTAVGIGELKTAKR